jgi:hypothetical protein
LFDEVQIVMKTPGNLRFFLLSILLTLIITPFCYKSSISQAQTADRQIDNRVNPSSNSPISAAVTLTGTTIISTNSGLVGVVNMATGQFTQRGPRGPVFTDLAKSNSGQLFGATFSQLYRINLGQVPQPVGAGFGFRDINALGFTPTNQLYAAGLSNFYRVNTVSGRATIVRSNIPGFRSSGDLLFDSATQQFFATSVVSTSRTSDLLFRINPANGQATLIGSIGFKNVFGLNYSQNGQLVGYTADRLQIIINRTTGAGTLNRNVTNLGTARINGATRN